MKRLLIIGILISLCIEACSRPESEAMTAAMEMYKKYADRSEKLTVAYIGNFEAEGGVYNAVMFQAQDSAEWEWLQEEFGLKSDMMMMPSMGQNMIVTSVKIDSTMQFASEEELMAYVDSLTKEIMAGATGNPDAGEGMAMNGMPLLSMEELQRMGVIDSGAVESGMLAMDGTLGEIDTEMLNQHQKLMDMTDEHQNTGYVIGSDAEAMTLWLFFYNTPEEQNRLMRKLYKRYGDGEMPR